MVTISCIHFVIYLISKTCFVAAEGSSIDVLLTNKYRSFQNSSVPPKLAKLASKHLVTPLKNIINSS